MHAERVHQWLSHHGLSLQSATLTVTLLGSWGALSHRFGGALLQRFSSLVLGATPLAWAALRLDMPVTLAWFPIATREAAVLVGLPIEARDALALYTHTPGKECGQRIHLRGAHRWRL